MTRIETKAPGKLYFLGEFSVVNGGKAILLPVDSYVHTIIQESNIPCRIDKDLILTNAAKSISEKYLKELGITIKNYSLRLKNDLVDKETNIKYGLGSSAAIMVSTIEAIMLFHNIKLSKLELYKLSVLGNLSLKKNGSMGDIATCVYQKPLIYKTFCKDKLNELINSNEKISLIIQKEWDGLVIEEVDVLNDFIPFICVIGWTRQSADTHNIVSKYNEFINSNPKYLEYFIYNSDEIIKACKNCKNQEDLNKAIEKFKFLLFDIQQKSNIEIVTNEAKGMIKIAEDLGFACKTSGAGNGDCVIACAYNTINLNKLKEEWIKLGVKVLNINIKWR